MTEQGFDSISPSARSLLLTKAMTHIPFAREAADLICGWPVLQDFQQKLSSSDFLKRMVHFESRYYSIDQALSGISIENIVEFSSGFSFRGLGMCRDPKLYWLDTDLPGITEIKKEITRALISKYCNYPANNFCIHPVNVLEGPAFSDSVSMLSQGPVALVNEGLLMYLEKEQKRKLCSIILKILKERGGYWITADIYIKGKMSFSALNEEDEQMKKFLADHHVEENKFDSFHAAELFFKNCGLVIFRKSQAPTGILESLKLLQNLSPSFVAELRNNQQIRETWVLMAA